MAGFDELKKKAAEVLGNEEQTDGALDKAANFLSEKTGGQHDDKIEKGRNFLDDKLGDGDEGTDPNQEPNQEPHQEPRQGPNRA